MRIPKKLPSKAKSDNDNNVSDDGNDKNNVNDDIWLTEAVHLSTFPRNKERLSKKVSLVKRNTTLKDSERHWHQESYSSNFNLT